MEICIASNYTSSSLASSISCDNYLYIISLGSVFLRKFVFPSDLLSSCAFTTGGTSVEFRIITSITSSSNSDCTDGGIRSSKVPSQSSLLIIDWVIIIRYYGRDTQSILLLQVYKRPLQELQVTRISLEFSFSKDSE
jgi:hypothetical protein